MNKTTIFYKSKNILIEQLEKQSNIEVLKEKDPKVILIGGTASGRVLAGKTAYAFDTELVCDASKLTYDEKQEQLIITRPAFDGKNMADFLIDPSLMNCMAEVVVRIPLSTWPPMTSVVIWAPPLYGTCTMSILASVLNSSPARCAASPWPR